MLMICIRSFCYKERTRTTKKPEVKISYFNETALIRARHKSSHFLMDDFGDDYTKRRITKIHTSKQYSYFKQSNLDFVYQIPSLSWVSCYLVDKILISWLTAWI